MFLTKFLPILLIFVYQAYCFDGNLTSFLQSSTVYHKVLDCPIEHCKMSDFEIDGKGFRWPNYCYVCQDGEEQVTFRKDFSHRTWTYVFSNTNGHPKYENRIIEKIERCVDIETEVDNEGKTWKLWCYDDGSQVKFQKTGSEDTWTYIEDLDGGFKRYEYRRILHDKPILLQDSAESDVFIQIDVDDYDDEDEDEDDSFESYFEEEFKHQLSLIEQISVEKIESDEDLASEEAGEIGIEEEENEIVLKENIEKETEAEEVEKIDNTQPIESVELENTENVIEKDIEVPEEPEVIQSINNQEEAQTALGEIGKLEEGINIIIENAEQEPEDLVSIEQEFSNIVVQEVEDAKSGEQEDAEIIVQANETRIEQEIEGLGDVNQEQEVKGQISELDIQNNSTTTQEISESLEDSSSNQSPVIISTNPVDSSVYIFPSTPNDEDFVDAPLKMMPSLDGLSPIETKIVPCFNLDGEPSGRYYLAPSETISFQKDKFGNYIWNPQTHTRFVNDDFIPEDVDLSIIDHSTYCPVYDDNGFSLEFEQDAYQLGIFWKIVMENDKKVNFILANSPAAQGMYEIDPNSGYRLRLFK